MVLPPTWINLGLAKNLDVIKSIEPLDKYTVRITWKQYDPVFPLRMVGSLADAEDIVQDTFVKWLSIDHQKIQNTKAYLIKAVTNNCLNHLNALMNKKEEYLDHLNLGEMTNKYMDFDLPRIDLETEIAAALAVVHKKLAPLERAIFLLREVFDFEYDDLQLLFDKKKDNCRQIFRKLRN